MPDKPVHFEITLDKTGVSPRNKIFVEGVDITRSVRGLRVSGSVDTVISIELDLLNVTLDLDIDVLPENIKKLLR